MSRSDETPSSSPVASISSAKRHRTPSPVNENEGSPHSAPVYALPPPMVTCASPPSTSTIVLTTSAMPPVAYYPVYTTHAGHFFIASPPLHPTITSSPHHQTKILPKPSSNHHAPATPVTLPTSPSSSAPYNYYHPFHPPPYPLPPPTPTKITTAIQREQARRQSHSAIEKRRREKINDKIMQLKQLIPACANQENLNKMSILQSTIEYISYLKDILEKADEVDREDTQGQQRQHQPIKLNWDLNEKRTAAFETTSTGSCISQFSIQQTHTYPTTTSTSVPLSHKSTNKEDIQKQRQCFNGASTPEAPETTKNMSLKNMLC